MYGSEDREFADTMNQAETVGPMDRSRERGGGGGGGEGGREGERESLVDGGTIPQGRLRRRVGGALQGSAGAEGEGGPGAPPRPPPGCSPPPRGTSRRRARYELPPPRGDAQRLGSAGPGGLLRSKSCSVALRSPAGGPRANRQAGGRAGGLADMRRGRPAAFQCCRMDLRAASTAAAAAAAAVGGSHRKATPPSLLLWCRAGRCPPGRQPGRASTASFHAGAAAGARGGRGAGAGGRGRGRGAAGVCGARWSVSGCVCVYACVWGGGSRGG